MDDIKDLSRKIFDRNIDYNIRRQIYVDTYLKKYLPDNEKSNEVLNQIVIDAKREFDKIIDSRSVNDLNYPETKTVSQKDNYHGIEIKDPYRWLEDDNSPEVKEWVKEQNNFTSDYLSRIPYRQKIKERYTELFDYTRYTIPYQAKDYYIFTKNDGLQNQSVWYIQKDLTGKPEIFLNPNDLSKDGTVSIAKEGISKNKKYLTYSVSIAGSDWLEYKIIEIASKKHLVDTIKWIKFSTAAWFKDGFFYSRYPEPDNTNINNFHSVYYHKIGDSQTEDQLIYRDDDNPSYKHHVSVTEDEKYLIMKRSPGSSTFSLYYKDLIKNGPLIPVFEDDKYNAYKNFFIHNIDNKFFIRTNIDAPNFRLIQIDINNPDKKNWIEIIPESEYLLASVTTGSENFLQTI